MKGFMQVLLISTSILMVSGQALASCPESKDVTFGCVVSPLGKHCEWSAPWYEGYQDTTAKQGDQVTFEKALWNSKTKVKTDLGSTVCFYQTSRGKEIHLSQNSWGGVPFPDGNWNYGEADGYAGWFCNGHNPESCGFLYPYN